MSAKRIILFATIVGSTAGGCAPSLWGGSSFSLTSIFLSVVGGILGIWIGLKIAERF